MTRQIRLRRMPTLSLLVALVSVGCQSTNQPLRLDTLRGASQSANPSHGQSPAVPLSNSQAKSDRQDFIAAQQDNHRANIPTHPLLSQPKQSTMDRLRNSASTFAATLATATEPAAGTVLASDPTSLQSVTGPIQPNLYLSAAKLLEQQGDLNGALHHYERLLADFPSHRNGLIGVARLHHRLGNMDTAISHYQLALTRIGEDPVILNDLGLCLARSGRGQEGIAALQKAVTARPDSLMYRNNLAASLVQTNQAEQAVAALAQFHPPAVAHYNVAYMLDKLGDVEQAQYYFGESLRHDPNFLAARRMMDDVEVRLGRRQDRDGPSSESSHHSDSASLMGTGSGRDDSESSTSNHVVAAVAEAIRDVPGQVEPIATFADHNSSVPQVDGADGLPIVQASAQVELPSQQHSSRPLRIRMARSADRKEEPGMIAPLPQ